MARFSLNKLTESERTRLVGEFYDAISLLKNREEVAKVFRDIMDGDEIGNIMRRIDVAVLLILGFTYDETATLLNVGKDKITRVQKKLNQGGEGYEILVQRILEKRKNKKIENIKLERKTARLNRAGSFERLKSKYPVHFLFWNLFDELGDDFYITPRVKGDKDETLKYYKTTKQKNTKK